VIDAGLLAAYALILAVIVPRILLLGSWPSRAPRLAIAVWLSATAAFLVTVLLTALSLAAPGLQVSSNLALLLQACWAALRASYSTTGGAALGGTGLTLGIGLLARVGLCVIRSVHRARRHADRYSTMLGLLGQPDAALGAVVVSHEFPAAFCLPGRFGTIVISSAAVAALTDAELAAVLAHEKAHQRGHHHLLLAVVEALAESFGRIPLLRECLAQLRYLLELLADDTAVRGIDRLTLAQALVSFASAGVSAPTGAMAAATGALPRIRRLLTPQGQLSAYQQAMTWSGSMLILAVPVVMAVLPALATNMILCPTQMPVAALACVR
jgi:hypothetical protein